MTIASEVQRIKTNIANAYTACNSKGATMPASRVSDNLASTINSISSGITPTGTLSITANGTYDVTNYASANVSVSGGGSTYPKGNYYVLNDGSIFPLYFQSCSINGGGYSNICIASYASDMSGVETGVIYSLPQYSSGDYSNIPLGKVSNVTMTNGYINANDVVHLNLTAITGMVNFGNNAFAYRIGFTSLKSVDCSNTTSAYLSGAFRGTPIESINLSSLSDLSTSFALGGTVTMGGAFANCTSLTTLSFPSLNSSSFGTRTNQFNQMLKGVTGCTVHFPSNLQSVIGSWTSVTGGFGGTNTTVLFDLPATT